MRSDISNKVMNLKVICGRPLHVYLYHLNYIKKIIYYFMRTTYVTKMILFTIFFPMILLLLSLGYNSISGSPMKSNPLQFLNIFIVNFFMVEHLGN